MTEYHSFIVEQSHLRLDQYLSGKLPDFSRSKIQNFIKQGQVTINGETGKPSQILQGNETVECHFEYDTVDESIIPEHMSLDIIYEDDDIAVINKASGIVVHPGNGNYENGVKEGKWIEFLQSHKTEDRY